jgi:hypothetical protein
MKYIYNDKDIQERYKEAKENYIDALNLIAQIGFYEVDRYIFNEFRIIELLTPDLYKHDMLFCQIKDIQNKIINELLLVKNTKWEYSWACGTLISEFNKLIDESNGVDDEKYIEAETWLCFFLFILFATDDRLKQYKEIKGIKLNEQTENFKQQIFDSLDLTKEYSWNLCNLGTKTVSEALNMEYLKPMVNLFTYLNIYQELKQWEEDIKKDKRNTAKENEKRFPKKFAKEKIQQLYRLLIKREYIIENNKEDEKIFMYYCGYGNKPVCGKLKWSDQANLLAYLINKLFYDEINKKCNYWSVAEKLFGVSHLARAKTACFGFAKPPMGHKGIDEIIQQIMQ